MWWDLAGTHGGDLRQLVVMMTVTFVVINIISSSIFDIIVDIIIILLLIRACISVILTIIVAAFIIIIGVYAQVCVSTQPKLRLRAEEMWGQQSISGSPEWPGRKSLIQRQVE